MTTILVLEEMSPAGLDLLRAEKGFEVREMYETDPGKIRAALAEADALILRSRTRVTAELLDHARRLKVIGRPGTGVDNIDVAAATRRGIVVMNTPAGNSISAAEHTIALMLALARRIPEAHASLREGKWERHRFIGSELNEKVLGIVGFGKIGMEVARRARSFNMKIVVYDPFVSDAVARDHGVALVGLDDLLLQADIVTLHAPLTASTRGLLGAEAFAKMKPGAFLINAARGELVDESALRAALESRHLAGAALDVFSSEPNPDPGLVRLANVVATPHIGASTVEAQEKVGYDIALQVRDYFQSGVVRNAVNFPSVSPSENRKLAPYLALAERLGSFASQISSGRMEEVTVRYYGELTEINTHLISSAVLVGVLKPILVERVTLVNAVESARERGIHMIESRSTRERSYSNLISVKLITDAGEEWVEGTVLHQNHLHIVSLDGIDVDAPLAGDMLIIRNQDTPGVIGRVGTLLGDNRINIANFALGRGESAPEAVGLVNVDSEIPEGVLDAIRALPQVKGAHLVRL
jgi:D-3-phosphoglycerate dehydrogenase